MPASALSLYASLLRGELEGDEALRASGHMFELVMSNVEQAIWWKDVNSVYLGSNQRLAEYAGEKHPRDLIGKTDADCAWGQIALARSGTEWFQDVDREVVESGEPVLGLREQVRVADGRVLWVETNKVPLKDFEGNVMGTLGTFTDITDRVEAEAELKRTLEELDERVRDRTKELSEANERLLQERSKADALRDTAAAVARSLHLDDVIDQVLQGVARLVNNRRSYVALYAQSGDAELAGQLAAGSDGDEAAEPHTVVPDLPNDPACASGVAADGTVILPLEVARERLGFLAIEPLEGSQFSAEDIGLMATIADQASSAISNSRALVMASSLAAVEERQRLANDLHDSVSQTLWTATLAAETLARSDDLSDGQRDQLDRLRLLTTGALSEMRMLLAELRPEVLEETPLADLAKQLCSAFESRKKVDCRLDLGPLPEILPTVKGALYRILQESLNNIARHAQASTVKITISQLEGGIVLHVSDDGIGFDHVSSQDHLGLRIMAERAAGIDAELDIDSSPGVGTSVTVTVPSLEGMAL